MLNISKCQAIVGCSAILTATLAGFSPSVMAQETNGSNASGTNVTTFPAPSVPSTGGGGPVSPFSPTTVSAAPGFFQRVSLAQTNYDRAAAALAQSETAQPTASNSGPVRYGREAADIASCGCPNADTASTGDTNRPELVAARAAEAEAAAELAKAKAEARQFIEAAKAEAATSASSGVSSPIW
jgi:hypothetical protein